MKNQLRTRYPWVYVLFGLLFSYGAWMWLREFRHDGQITMYRGGSAVTAYSGSPAILVIVVTLAFGLSLLVMGIVCYAKKTKLPPE
jgi:hypothetical protein